MTCGLPQNLRSGVVPQGRAHQHTRNHLQRIIGEIIPSLANAPISMAACVTSFTPENYPAIGYATDRIAVLTGGCGAAAKSSDEIGRLGSELILHGRIVDEAYGDVFCPVFTD